MKVLIVEDDIIIANMYRIKFSNAGYDVQTASDGEQGLVLMKTFHPDIVLLDLMMPVLDGFSALQRAKADDEIKNIPIIVLTNLSMAEDATKTLQAGAVDYIVKSNLTPGQVLEKVEKYIKTA